MTSAQDLPALVRWAREAEDAVIAPLRHPLLLARELGTLDLLSGGRRARAPRR